MSAFFLFDVRSVNTPDKLDVYRSKVLKTVTSFGGRYRVLGGPVQVLEGAPSLEVPVLIEFPDVAAAQSWYGSSEYSDLKVLRRQAADCTAVLVDGCEDPPMALVAER